MSHPLRSVLSSDGVCNFGPSDITSVCDDTELSVQFSVIQEMSDVVLCCLHRLMSCYDLINTSCEAFASYMECQLWITGQQLEVNIARATHVKVTEAKR